jgi:transposase-like protein
MSTQNMSEKRKNGENIHNGKRRVITMETKVEIIKRHEKGNKFVDIARAYGINESTVRTIKKIKFELCNT